MKKLTKILTSGLLIATLCTPAFATSEYVGDVNLETHTYAELMNDPNVSFMDDSSIIATSITPYSTSYTSYIDVGVNAAVYGQKRQYDAGVFGSRVYNIECDESENSGTLKVSLCDVSILGSYNQLESKSSSIGSNTTSVTYTLSQHAAGKYAFQYTTSGSLALYADVTMYSN